MDTHGDDLTRLANAHGVATSYDAGGHRVEVAPETIIAVLAQFDVDATTPESRARALAEHTERRAAAIRRPDPAFSRVVGATRATVVPPPRLRPPPRCWGWMTQLYATRSTASWGIGDLADLRTLVRWSAGLDAGLILVNPLSAITPVAPVQRSPYSPSSRRFHNLVHLRIEDTPAYREAPAELRARVDDLRPPNGDLIDYDEVFRAKTAALELLYPGHLESDPALREFGTFCALAEIHGPDWRRWPVELRVPDSPAVDKACAELAHRVGFHAWTQHLLRRQLAEVRTAAADMLIGVVHDLPVGVDPGGADAWSNQRVLAENVTVGAPPDAFNQRGQDWGLPPWRPDRLAEYDYGPYRDMLRAILAHADGIRVDHVMGLWRLWWIPPGHPPTMGTYVHYDPTAMLGILTEEAAAAGAVVIGEDLGTVAPGVREAMRAENVLGTSVMWFERDHHGGPLPPEHWPELSTATISTHDLPTAPGFLVGEQVRARAELGLLDHPERERDQARAEVDALLDLLRHRGLLTGEADEDAVITAMHTHLGATNCRLALASLHDVLGERRQPNLPGTVDEYPNWRLPLPMSLEDIRADPRIPRLIAGLRAARTTRPRR